MSANLVWQPGLTLEELEKIAIRQAISFYKGNKTTTAAALGMSVRSLDMKLQKYGEDEESERKRQRKEKFDRENQTLRARGLDPIAELPEETEEEKNDRTYLEEKQKRENFLKRQRGERVLDPNSLEAGRLRIEREGKTPKENGKVPAKGMESAEAGLHAEPAESSSKKHEVSMPQRKEVQGVLSKPDARSSNGTRR